jgi:hypothetical protein
MRKHTILGGIRGQKDRVDALSPLPQREQRY